MSRIGKLPVKLEGGAKAQIGADGTVTIEGPKGKLSLKPSSHVKVAIVATDLVVSLKDEGSQEPQAKADFGTTRALLKIMVGGVTNGYKKSLEMVGVGFQAKVAGQKLTISCGFSHDVTVELPKEIKVAVEKNTTIHLESINKELLGTWAARIRQIQPPEPYLGKGIKYVGESIRRKAGKAGKK